MDTINYPLEELVKIKQKRFEQAVKLVEEKKIILKREQDTLKNLEKDRNEVLKHKEEKLKQLREALDSGESTDKIRQKKDYYKIVQENLIEKEKKVKNQEKNVNAAEKELEIARKNLMDKQKDIEKLEIHRKQWEKEMKYFQNQKEEVFQDEIGSVKHIMKKKKSN